MPRKFLSIVLSAFLIFAVPVTLSSCSCSGSSNKGTTMTDKQKKDAEYGKKLMDGVDDMKKNGAK